MSWHRNGRDLALSIESADSPGEVFCPRYRSQHRDPLDRHSAVGGVRRPFCRGGGDLWRSFDNMVITGFLHRPNPRDFPGKRPVIISIHGGPESLARPGFRSRHFWINERGYALITPNVRSSAGFGRRFMEADNQKKRETRSRDITRAARLDHAQPDLDPTRVAVVGASYGGFMALASSVAYAPRLVAAIDSAGISHFVTLLEGTETYRRDLARAEYGDEREPDMRRYLDAISPLSHAEKIRVPLLVSHGRNDPQVPVTEAEQIVRKVRQWHACLVRAGRRTKGHGFTQKSNVDYLFAAQTLFLDRYLQRRN